MTSRADHDDVKALSDKLGIIIQTIDITSPVESFRNLLGIRDMRFLGNVKSRVRMITLYYFSAFFNGLVVGTTNRSEYMTGYFTKFGDGACDIEPIMHLYKDEVRKIARYLRVPAHIIDKKPSAGLWESQTDEEEMGFTYDQLDSFLRSHPSPGSGFVPGNPTERRIFDMILKSEHKRHTPYSLMGREDV
jgi:NAD+ synthase